MEAEAAEAAPAQGASVGVLGWLGFVIVNFAAFGIIGAGTTISWVIGFVLGILYTGVLVAFAVILQKRGAQYARFVNLLWVLGCVFLFIDGVYVSINIIGPLDGTDVTGGDSGFGFGGSSNDLAALLPDGASQALQDWSISQAARDHQQWPGFASFGGLLFFASPANAEESWRDVLWRSSVSDTSVVDPVLQDPRSFVEFGADLFFAARSEGSNQEGVYYVAGASPEGTVQQLYSSSVSSFQVRAFFVDAASSSLYFSVSYYCDNGPYTESLIRSDGTRDDTEDLRDDPCLATTTSSNGEELPERGADAEYWGIIFVAAIPMMALAAYVMYSRQIYGVFANVYGGVATVALMLFLLASDDMNNLLEFNKWFYTIYSSTLYVALLVLAVVRDSLPEWLEEMKTWAVALVAGTFFVIIHVDLEIPFSGEAWAWVLYSVLALLQMAASVVLARTMPMACGALCAFVLSWKISWETVVLFGGENWGGGLQLLTVFGLMALLGIGIIVLAVAYASRRAEIEAFVQDAIRRRRGEKAVEPVGEAASAP